MLTPYLVLGVATDAEDAEIRRCYLEEIRRAGRDGERISRVTTAYERIKDERARVREALFGVGHTTPLEVALNDLVQARNDTPTSPRLSELLAAEREQ